MLLGWNESTQFSSFKEKNLLTLSGTTSILWSLKTQLTFQCIVASKLHSNPFALQTLGDISGGVATRKWVKHHISWIR